MLLTEWNQDEYLEVACEEAREEGREQGLEEGRQEGRQEGRKEEHQYFLEMLNQDLTKEEIRERLMLRR